MKSYENAKHNIDGEIGEEVVLRFFQNNKKFEKITDVRKTEEYRTKDIDFVVKKRFDEWTTRKFNVEVKTDIMAGKYGNFFVEKENKYKVDCKIANAGDVKEGWIDYSQCDYFFFYVPKHDRIYVISRDKLKNYIDYWHPTVRTCKDYHKDTTGYCVKIKHLMQTVDKAIAVFDGTSFKRLDNKKIIDIL